MRGPLRASTREDPNAPWAARLGFGGLGIAVGVAILVSPDIALGRLSTLLGLLLVGSGTLVSIAAWRVRKLAQRLRARTRVQLAVFDLEIRSARRAVDERFARRSSR